MAKLIEVIESHTLKGKGTDDSPLRNVYQLFTKDGELISEHDPKAPAPMVAATEPQTQAIVDLSSARLTQVKGLTALLMEVKEALEIWERNDSHLYEKVCRALQVEA